MIDFGPGAYFAELFYVFLFTFFLSSNINSYIINPEHKFIHTHTHTHTQSILSLSPWISLDVFYILILIVDTYSSELNTEEKIMEKEEYNPTPCFISLHIISYVL
jgi:hypothetical protein